MSQSSVVCIVLVIHKNNVRFGTIKICDLTTSFAFFGYQQTSQSRENRMRLKGDLDCSHLPESNKLLSHHFPVITYSVKLHHGLVPKRAILHVTIACTNRTILTNGPILMAFACSLLPSIIPWAVKVLIFPRHARVWRENG